MKNIALVIITAFLCSCSSGLPSEGEIKSALQNPILSNVTYNGVALPQGTVELKNLELLSIEGRSIGNTRVVDVKANASVALKVGGNEINNMLLRSGGIRGALSAQQFTRSMGFSLQQGHVLEYKVDATLKKEDDSFVVIDGSVSER